MFILTAFALAVASTSVVYYNGNVLHSSSSLTITAVDSTPITYEEVLTFNSGRNDYYDDMNQYVSYFGLQNYEDTSIYIPISIKFGVDSSYSWYSWSVMIDKTHTDFVCNLSLDLTINYSDMTYRFPTCYFYDNSIYNSSTGAIYNEPFTPPTPVNITLSCRLLPGDLMGYIGSYDDGYREGYQVGYDSGTRVGSDTGYSEGYEEGRQVGFAEGEQSGLGYQNGYRDGYNNGITHSSADFGFMNLFTSIADTPILMLRSMFDFSIFGTSVLAVVLSLFTALVVIHLLKRFIK